MVVVTFFTRNNFKTVKNPRAELFNEPIQTNIENPELIKFHKDGYDFTLTPFFDYEMNALVVNRFDYTWFSLQRTDSAFPLDLCVTWGKNIESGAYLDRSLHFRQDGRFCYANWSYASGFDWGEVSNNHLVIKDDVLQKKAFSISEGDQVRIRGKLVSVEAKNADGQLEKYESSLSKWSTSTTRGDSGAGACEVIYVEELEILEKANPISYYGFWIGLWLLLAFVAWRVLAFFWEMVRGR